MSTYQQAPNSNSYWAQGMNNMQSYQTELPLVPSNPQPCDLANLPSDLFQPEEIFQLDQPIKQDLVQLNQSDVARSPPTLLDLGSGTIHKEFKNEDYWNQSVSSTVNDDSNSNSSRFHLSSSPDNTQISINNNQIHMQNGLSHYGDDLYNLQKQDVHYFGHVAQDNNYKTEDNFVELVNDTKLFFADDNFTGIDSSFQNIKQFNRSVGETEKYVDVPQYVDYSSIFSSYDSKTNDRLVNELDFRITNCLTNNVHYNMENFDIMHQ